MSKLRGLLRRSFIKICSKLGWIGMVSYHFFQYHQLRGHCPNFKNPKDLSERILSSMHKKSFLEYVDLADKVRVRDYVKSKGLESILLKHYGSWENANDIDFSKLPEKFALKPNNGSGDHIFCKDKKILDIKKTINHLNNALKLDSIGYSFEPHYKKIKPLIFCEELIDTGSNSWPTDYKFTCIRGHVEDIFVAVEREVKTKYCTLDANWELLNYTKPEYIPKKMPEKPRNLSRMIEIAEILSKDFDFVRVDLYESGDQIYFGELTFSPWGGMMYSYTNDAIKILGNKF